MKIRYDIEGLIAESRASLLKFVVKMIAFSLLILLSIFMIILYGSYVAVFACGILVAGVCLFLLFKLIRKFNVSDYSSISGKVTHVHKEIKTVDTMSVGGINPFGTRRYDSYKRDEIRLSIFIENENAVRVYHLKGATEEHLSYYESAGEVMHIWGTHFPVILSPNDEKWLCPVCGRFNKAEDKACSECGRGILR